MIKKLVPETLSIKEINIILVYIPPAVTKKKKTKINNLKPPLSIK